MRILLVTYAFPPLNVIASHRPWSWATAWRDLGHEVEVLTVAKHAFDGSLDLARDLSGIQVHELPYVPGAQPGDRSAHDAAWWEKVKTVTRRARFSLGPFADPRLLAWRPMVRRGLERCAARPFDFILATSPPEAMFLVARTLSGRTRTPWVADFRDLWFRDMLLFRSRLASWLAGPLNRWLVRDAAVLVTVSRGLEQRLSAYLGREVVVSYNGFFEEEAAPPVPPAAEARRRIVYTGRLYPGKRDPEPLFRALTALRRESPDVSERVTVDFYGFDDPWLRSLVDRHAVGDCVRLHGFVSYRESIALQRAADALLFLDWSDSGAEGVLTGKLFEYLGSGRPILAIGPRKDSEAARLISETGAGTTLISEAEIAQYLQRLAASPRPAAVSPGGPAAYSRERQAASLLESILERLRASAPHRAA